MVSGQEGGQDRSQEQKAVRCERREGKEDVDADRLAKNMDQITPAQLVGYEP
jgi:hypothetical protein